jgi:hypothetical protein
MGGRSLVGSGADRERRGPLVGVDVLANLVQDLALEDRREPAPERTLPTVLEVAEFQERR